MENKKIAYKGFDKDLKCRGEKFEIGQTYTKPEKENPKVCSNDGWHFCYKLSDCFDYYSNNNHNVFCEIEVLGNENTDGNKSITTSFRIVRQITLSEIRGLEISDHLEKFRIISSVYPQVVLGGSLALAIYGCNIKRDFNKSDLDIQVPYYIKFRKQELGDSVFEIRDTNIKNSGDDFDYGFGIEFTRLGFVKVDMVIRPNKRYNIVKFNGFEYKVALLEDIWEAKIRYARNGQQKHIDDLLRCMNIDSKNFE